MIVTGRYVYKKYKKHKAAKEASLAADSSNHDRQLQNSQLQIEDSPVDQLGETVANAPPPTYYETSPSRSSGRDVKYEYQQVRSPPSPNPTNIAPTPSPYQSQQQLPTTVPTEIAVRGKWVWVAEDAAPLPSTSSPVPSTPTPGHEKNADMNQPHSFAIELPAFSDPKEMAVDENQNVRRSVDAPEGYAELDSSVDSQVHRAKELAG